MSRVTEKDLMSVVKRLNEVSGNPTESHTILDGKYIANAGHYHIDFSYGHVRVVQYCNDGGGIRDVTSPGTKPEIYREIHRFIDGYVQCQRDMEKVPEILATLNKRLKGE